jgi:hypothetical protein
MAFFCLDSNLAARGPHIGVPAIFHSMLEGIRIRHARASGARTGFKRFDVLRVQKFAAVAPGQPRLRGDRFGGTIQASTAGRMIRGN